MWKKVYRVYDEKDCGRMIKQFATLKGAMNYANKHSIYYSVKEAKVIVYELRC
jgi:hypothetical protein